MTASSFNIGPQYIPDAPANAIPALDSRPRTMSRAPHCVNITELDAAVASIGMPFDQSALDRPGARCGPDALRYAPLACAYSDPYGAGQDAEGFCDADSDAELLRGVTMADCGNISVTPSEVLRNCLAALARRANPVAFDLVKVAPPYDLAARFPAR